MAAGKEKETVITIMVGFIVLYAIFSRDWLWMVALGTGLAAMLSDALARWIHIGWFWIAGKLGYVMSRVVLGAIFTVILLPLAAVARLFRGDFMLLKSTRATFYVKRSHMYQRKDLENPW